MSTIDSISLDPGDLVNKWGFGDGDMAIDILEQWIQTTPHAEIRNDERYHDHPIWQYYSYRVLLMEIVEKFLMPAIAEELPPHRLFRMHTVHNPVRIEPALNEDESEYEERAIELENILTSLDCVEVTGEQLQSLCDSVFPARTDGWILLYAVLGYQLDLPKHFVDQTTATGPFDHEPHRYAPAVLDQYLKKHTDGGLRLAAELLQGKISRGEIQSYKLSPSDIEEAFTTVDMLIR